MITLLISVLGGVIGALITLSSTLLLRIARKARRDRSGHLCYHSNGAHRCKCRWPFDHGVDKPNFMRKVA